MAKTRFAKWYDAKWGNHSPKARKSAINHIKRTMCNHVREWHDDTVAYGPFRGMKLPAKSWWGSFDRTGKILGTYERQVMDYIAALKIGPQDVFIDIGAADGYFAVGALKGGLFDKVIAFEQAPQGRASLADVAELNGVTLDIRETADATSLDKLVKEHPTGVVLIDIEGAEFQFLDDTVLQILRKHHVIIELHRTNQPEGKAKRAALIDRASAFFDHTSLHQAPIPIGSFPELAQFNDDHRLLAFSENRLDAMEWLTLTPKTSAQ